MYLLVGPVEQVFIALSYLIVPALSAHFAAKRMDDFMALWKRCGMATLGISALYAVIVRLVGKRAVHILYAGKYDGLSAYLFVLTLVPLIMWVGGTMGHALNAVERPHSVFWAYVSGGIATFVVGIPLVMHLDCGGQFMECWYLAPPIRLRSRLVFCFDFGANGERSRRWHGGRLSLARWRVVRKSPPA